MSRHTRNLTAAAVIMMFGLVGCGGIDDQTGIDDTDEARGMESYGVSVKTNKLSYKTSEKIKATVVNNYYVTPIYLPGCNPIALEVFKNNAWTAVAPQNQCVFEGVAEKVLQKTELVVELAAKPVGSYRVRLDFKTGCKVGQTFSQCQGTVKTRYSTTFKVKAAPPAVCGDMEDWAFDNCVPDDDEPMHASCLEDYPGGLALAHTCCNASPDFVYCDSL